MSSNTNMSLENILAYLKNSGANIENLGFRSVTHGVATQPMDLDEKVYEIDAMDLDQPTFDCAKGRIAKGVDPRLSLRAQRRREINEFLRQMAQFNYTRLEHSDATGTLFATRKSNSRCVTLWVDGVKCRALLPKAPRCGHKTAQGRCKRHTWENACYQHQ